MLKSLLMVSFLSFGFFTSCKPAEVVEYQPSSVEEQFFLTNEWCGYDMTSYEGIPNTKIRTLYKIKLDLTGNLKIDSVTQTEQYFIPQTFDVICDFTGPSQLSCQGINLVYQLYDQYIITDLLPRLFNGLKTTQLSLCSVKQKEEF